MEDKEIAVKVQDLTKSFKIPLESSNGLKQKLINTLKGRKGYRDFTPLNDISFEIEKGDFFGIVGRNGSGKSTLLKTIAGIYAPNKGGVFVNGTLVPFIELGVGFNPELSGRENVFLNGALLGFSHTEMEAMYDDIVEFAELEAFMEERLKNYSSGMQVRLAFSIAIKAQGDILLLDEVLAVGDAAFQAKCQEYFQDIKNRKKTVILVTHDMASVERYCNKAMLLHDGEVILYGSPKKVADAYSDLNRAGIEESINDQIESDDIESNDKNEDADIVWNGAKITGYTVTDKDGNKRRAFKHGELMKFRVTYTLNEDIDGADLDIGITQGINGPLMVYQTTYDTTEKVAGKKQQKVTATFEVKNIFMGGAYYLVSTLFNVKDNRLYARNRKICKVALDELKSAGLVMPENKFNILSE